MPNNFTLEVVELRTHRCACSWWLTEAELERAGDSDTFRCLHREDNPFRDMAVIRLSQAELQKRAAENIAHACKN